MKSLVIAPADAISLFVKNIITFSNTEKDRKTVLPFYADGYPGIMFQLTQNGLYVLPQNKQMPELFLYGQTIHPIELKIDGSFQFIVFQLYPFVISGFFGVNPKDLNDECYDLGSSIEIDAVNLIAALKKNRKQEHWIRLISTALLIIFSATRDKIDFKILQAVQAILRDKGQQTIAALRQNLHVPERSFERRFLQAVGVTPKQFSKIIQFQHSMEDITSRDFSKLTDVVYKNGFADQSHFIRVFKAFTGKTPRAFNPKSS